MKPHSAALPLLIVAVLAAMVLFVYGPVTNYPFTNYDDDDYIGNPHVRQGLTINNVIWSFTTTRNANWHPLTWLSHMLDVQLFGMKSGRHHLVSVLLHALNAGLLFLLLKSMTGSSGSSAVVAALFAVHPLNVDSVTWVAERKNVLSAFFGFLAVMAWVAWVKNRGQVRYLAAVLSFALSLMSKPMLVTLPFLLLLFDYWPLGRTPLSPSGARGNGGESPGRLLLEKAPFFLLSAAASIATFLAQHSGGAVESLENLPFRYRLANAALSWASYPAKTVWPSRLAVFYPHPENTIPAWLAAASFLGLAAVTALAVWMARRLPSFAVGWFWYLGTLIPVIGLVQVGSHGMANRYAYITIIGLFVAAVWGIGGAAGRSRRRREAGSAIAAMAIALFMLAARIQVAYWRSPVTLFKHALAVTSGNTTAHCLLGVALADEGKLEDAVAEFNKALVIDPGYAGSYNNLGAALLKLGRPEEAIENLRTATLLESDFPQGHFNLGLALQQSGREGEAEAEFRLAIRQDAEYTAAYDQLGSLLLRYGRLEDAVAAYGELLRLDPGNAPAHNSLGRALAELGRIREAEEHFRRAVSLRPDMGTAYYNLGVLLAQQGRDEEAFRQYREVLRLKPDDAETHNNLGVLLAKNGKLESALSEFKEALRLNPDYLEARINLDRVMAEKP